VHCFSHKQSAAPLWRRATRARTGVVRGGGGSDTGSAAEARRAAQPRRADVLRWSGGSLLVGRRPQGTDRLRREQTW